MSMPWEDFQQAGGVITNAIPTIPAEAGGGNSNTPPWEDFKQANPHLGSVLKKNQTPAMLPTPGLGGQLLEGLKGIGQAFTPSALLQGGRDILHMPGQALQSLHNAIGIEGQKNPMSQLFAPPEIDPKVWQGLSNKDRMQVLGDFNKEVVNETPQEYEQRKHDYETRAQMTPGTLLNLPGGGLMPLVIPNDRTLVGSPEQSQIPFRKFHQPYPVPGQAMQTLQAGLEPIAELPTQVIQPEMVALGAGLGAAPASALKVALPVIGAGMAASSAESISDRVVRLLQEPNMQNTVNALTGIPMDALTGLIGAHGVKYGMPKPQSSPAVLSPENIQAATSPGLAELRMQADIPQIMKQLPERSQQLSEQAKVEAQAKLDASQNLPPTSPEGFIAGNRGIVPASDAFAVNDVTRPKALLEAPKVEDTTPQEGSRPPFIAGATSAQGVEGVTPVTREMQDTQSQRMMSGVDPTEAAKMFHNNLLSLGYAVRAGDNTHAQEIWKKNEEIKNKWFGGETPPKPGVEQGKLFSGIPVPTKAEDWQKFRGAAGMGANDNMTHQGVKFVLNEAGFKNPDVGVDAGQLKNRMVNKLGEGSGEVKMWRALGLDEKFKAGEATTPREMAQWMQENGPKVEVRKFGVGSARTLEQKRFIELEHIIDSRPDKSALNHYLQYNDKPTYDTLTPESKKIADEYNILNKKELHEGVGESHWQSVAPKAEKDMPGYVEIAVVKGKKDATFDKKGHVKTDAKRIQFPSSHNFPANTLGFVRGYMENIGGKKVFHVIEVQSDWAQKVRQTKERAKTAGMEGDLGAVKDDPLLPHYERLALKAAIDHARNEGADAIVISDAETAMMSEWHDLRPEPSVEVLNKIQEEYSKPTNRLGTPEHRAATRKAYAEARPSQEGGMRLHYDLTLPKIAYELTGDKGQRVEMGEHKGAFEQDYDRTGNPKTRKDLIFHNPDGTPKTSVSGRLYAITKPSERLASGEPMTTMGKMYSGVPLPDNLKDITDKVILGAGKISSNVSEYIKSRPLRQTMAYMKDATSNLVGKNANESASRVSGMLERATKMPDKRDSLNRQALTMLIEAEQDPKMLQEMRETLTKPTIDEKGKAIPVIAKDREAALKAVNYALKNLDMLKPVADEYSKLIEMEARFEESAGRKIERRKGYVMHLAEDTGDATSFIHAREFNTLADRIAAGVPAGSLDAVELLRSRVARGQQVYVQSKVFVDNVRKLKDKDGQPIIGEYVKVPRGPGHADDVQVPKGYREVQMGFHKVPVLEPYADTLQALTAPSWFMQRALGRGLLEVRGVGKHIVLGFDTFHLGRLATFGASAKLGTGNAPSLRYSRGVTILDNTAEELTAKAKAGQLDMKDLPQILADKKILDIGVKTGYNIGRNIDAFNQHWTEHIPVSGTFQKWLFNTFQRGVMADVYVKAWDAYKAQMPKATDAAIARKLSSDLNTTFGTIGRQGWIRSRTGQDIMSMFFLAPQWTEGRIKSDVQGTLGAMKNIGQLAMGKRPEVSMQTRVVGTTILAYLVANQAINMMTTGHSTFENEKGHELDAFVPDVMSGGKGYWLNPSANATEVFHAMRSSLEKEGGDVWQAWLDFVGGRLSTVARPVATAVTGKQWGITGPDVLEPDGSKPGYGGPTGSAKFLGGLKNLVQAPIGVPQLGDILMGNVDKNSEKALLSRFGFKVDNAQAPLTPAERKELGKKKKVVVR